MIGSFTQLLAKDLAGKLGAENDESVSYIVDGVKRMQSLVGDLLAYARLAAHPPQLKETDSEEILQDTLDDLRMGIADAGATVTHDPLPHLRADPGQMRELFQNLVANALKFRGADAPAIHISVRPSSGFWVFSVCDNGIGIPPEYQEAIFGAFKRLHSRAEFEGTGMGLAICRKIAERHGGRIWVESEPGRGSTFHFSIPTALKGESKNASD
jgi:light-regulated signal transduction histidine kinase (bacteriophytochrome)